MNPIRGSASQRRWEERRRKWALRAERCPALKYIHQERLEVNERGLEHLCMYCEANPVKTRGGDICADRECMTRWNSDYAKGRREHERAQKRKEPQPDRTCACGCGATFAFDWTKPDRKYVEPRHGRKVWKSSNPEKVRAQRARRNAKKRAARAALPKALPFVFGNRGSSRKALRAFWRD